MHDAPESLAVRLETLFLRIISETNGIALEDTLKLCLSSLAAKADPALSSCLVEFREELAGFHREVVGIEALLDHPVARALAAFFRNFPLKYREEHIHLTGSLTADFVYPRLAKILQGPSAGAVREKIRRIYGDDARADDLAAVDRMIRLKEGEQFDRYLKILFLPKAVLVDRETHAAAAYSMAEDLYTKHNVGFIRLKFSYDRGTQDAQEQIPGLEALKGEDIVLGLHQGFEAFKRRNPDFNYVLSPSFRKESHFFDANAYPDKQTAFLHQVEEIIGLLKAYPFLRDRLTDVDTVGDERDLFRKEHFQVMRLGLRKLHFQGLKVRSHHGEVWRTLRRGIQAVDNAMNIWHIDTLEHGLALGINPNFHYHLLFERVMELNVQGKALEPGSALYREVADLDWGAHTTLRDGILAGQRLSTRDIQTFTKIKFHTAREVEHYQHDVLNRVIDKGVGLTSLPSSNSKLTGAFAHYRDHPFSWWEKKGVSLGMGTDNYIGLNTNFIREMLIVLFTDAENLKITKLLKLVSGEARRPYLSHLLWEMRELNEFPRESR